MFAGGAPLTLGGHQARGESGRPSPGQLLSSRSMASNGTNRGSLVVTACLVTKYNGVRACGFRVEVPGRGYCRLCECESTSYCLKINEAIVLVCIGLSSCKQNYLIPLSRSVGVERNEQRNRR